MNLVNGMQKWLFSTRRVEVKRFRTFRGMGV